MILLLTLIGLSVSPADSARAMISMRGIPEAAVLYAQMAAAEEGAWLVEYGRILEASGEFSRAARIYGLALGNSTSEETGRWLLNRIQGCSTLDTTLTLTVTITNSGSMTARDIQVIIPMPVSHLPYQELALLQNDFSISSGVLYADIPCIPSGSSEDLTITMRLFQEPMTMRPISPVVSDETLEWLSGTLRNLSIPDVLPGPCVPMSREMSRLAEEIDIGLSVTGGVILDRDSCVFHAWNVMENTGIRIDPVLFGSDSLLGLAHNPSDVIPLWNLDSTDGCELTILYGNPDFILTGNMTAILE